MDSERRLDPQSPYDIDGELAHLNLRKSSDEQSDHSVFPENSFFGS